MAIEATPAWLSSLLVERKALDLQIQQCRRRLNREQATERLESLQVQTKRQRELQRQSTRRKRVAAALFQRGWTYQAIGGLLNIATSSVGGLLNKRRRELQRSHKRLFGETWVSY